MSEENAGKHWIRIDILGAVKITCPQADHAKNETTPDGNLVRDVRPSKKEEELLCLLTLAGLLPNFRRNFSISRDWLARQLYPGEGGDPLNKLSKIINGIGGGLGIRKIINDSTKEKGIEFPRGHILLYREYVKSDIADLFSTGMEDSAIRVDRWSGPLLNGYTYGWQECGWYKVLRCRIACKYMERVCHLADKQISIRDEVRLKAGYSPEDVEKYRQEALEQMERVHSYARATRFRNYLDEARQESSGDSVLAVFLNATEAAIAKVLKRMEQLDRMLRVGMQSLYAPSISNMPSVQSVSDAPGLPATEGNSSAGLSAPIQASVSSIVSGGNESLTLSAAAHSMAPESRYGWKSLYTPLLNSVFTGRTEILDALQTALQRSPDQTAAAMVALTGLPGIGKTQIASYYANEQAKNYNGVFWIPAETLDVFKEGIVQIAREMDVPGAQRATQNEAVKAVYRWFDANAGWLLILDNVDDISALVSDLPRSSEGSILLTTRAWDTTQWFYPIEVAKLTKEDGARLLLMRAHRLGKNQTLGDLPIKERDAALELSRIMDGLPLALTHMGAYIRQRKRSAVECLEEYNQRGLSLLNRYADRDHESVTFTFSNAIAALENMGEAGHAAVKIMRLCAFLAPDAIPELLFEPSELGVDFERSADAIFAYSLMDRNPKTKTLSIHRLLQEVIRQTMTAGERKYWMERAVHIIAEATVDFESKDWSLCDALLPHWRRCIEYIQSSHVEPSMQAAFILNQTGRYLRIRAQYVEAEGLLCSAIEMVKSKVGEIHTIVANTMSDLAGLCRELGRYKEARDLYETVLRIYKESDGEESYNVGTSYHNLGVVYVAEKENAKAEQFFREALRIREVHAEENCYEVAGTLNQLAGACRFQGPGRCEEAEQLFLRMLALYESEELQSYQADRASGFNNLGNLYVDMGRFDEAESLYLKALEINKKVYGCKDHPEIAKNYLGLANLRWKQGRRAENEELAQRWMSEADERFQQALKMFLATWPAEHPTIVRMSELYREFQTERSANRPQE